MGGIVSYASYLPHYRLKRALIGSALGTQGGRGSRSVACFDEDTTTMGVEAGRQALAGVPDIDIRALYFSTTRPAYQDKTNANAIHAALRLDQSTATIDMIGSVRSGVGALRTALQSPQSTLVVLSDIRTGAPGSIDEREGGDGAASFLCSPGGNHMAEYLGGATATAEFLDRWRSPGDLGARLWEERFGEEAYLPMAKSALLEATKQVGIETEEIDHLIVTGTHYRSAARLVTGELANAKSVVSDFADTVGNTGAAHPGLMLASALDKAAPLQIIALVVLSDGCDVLFFRTTDLITAGRQQASVEEQLALTQDDLSYPRFQMWRGVFRMESPRRPDPDPPAAPPSFRTRDWKYALVGSACVNCGTRHLPPQEICMSCRSMGQMTPELFANRKATVSTFTIDHLAFSENPPLVVAALDFDGGGRFLCELTEVDADDLKVGDQVDMTFRRIHTASGIHNYFWKARPIKGEIT